MKAQTYNFETWIKETDPLELEYIKLLLCRAGFGVLNTGDHYFEPQGYSCLYLLSESHLSIHTYPEEDCTNIQLSSCVKKPFERFITLFIGEITTKEQP